MRTDIPQSARPLTKGEFNDRAGVFHPDSERVVFLSNRRNAGKSVHIYVVDLNSGDAEPVLLSLNFGKSVQAFDISPDGHFIAFTSNDDAISVEARRVEDKDDVQVFGGREVMREVLEGFARPRVYSFSTGKIWTLEGVRKDHHIEAFTWSPDRTRLLYRLRQGRGPECAEERDYIRKHLGQ